MRRQKQRILAALLSLVLLLALVPAGWADDGDNTTNATDPASDFLSEKNTVNIILKPQGADEAFTNDIITASVQADLYLITKAKAVEGYDTYEYESLTKTPFKDLQGDLDKALKTDPSKPETIANPEVRMETMLKNFTPLAYQFADIVLADSYTAKATKSASANGASTITVSGLEAGLYLLVLRGSNLTHKHLMLPENAEEKDKEDYGYVTTTVKKLSDYGPDGTQTNKKHIATRAFSDKYEYLFEPQLITVPTRVDKDTKEQLQYNTAFGVWSNTLNVNIKAEQEKRKGKIKVKKTLSDYLDLGKDETFEPAVFTFDIIARKTDKTDSEVLYRRQVSINFDGPDAVGKTEILKDLPAGSYAWVSETYQGAHYTGTPTGNVGPIEVKADKIVEVDGKTAIQEQTDNTASFDNKNNDTHRGGHGIENRIEYGDDGWKWTANGTTPGQNEEVVS